MRRDENHHPEGAAHEHQTEGTVEGGVEPNKPTLERAFDGENGIRDSLGRGTVGDLGAHPGLVLLFEDEGSDLGDIGPTTKTI